MKKSITIPTKSIWSSLVAIAIIGFTYIQMIGYIIPGFEKINELTTETTTINNEIGLILVPVTTYLLISFSILMVVRIFKKLKPYKEKGIIWGLIWSPIEGLIHGLIAGIIGVSIVVLIGDPIGGIIGVFIVVLIGGFIGALIGGIIWGIIWGLIDELKWFISLGFPDFFYNWKSLYFSYSKLSKISTLLNI